MEKLQFNDQEYSALIDDAEVRRSLQEPLGIEGIDKHGNGCNFPDKAEIPAQTSSETATSSYLVSCTGCDIIKRGRTKADYIYRFKLNRYPKARR